MDDSSFDRITRDLARGISRRTMIKSLLGLSGMAATGALVTLDHARAARRGYSGPSLPSAPTPPPTCPTGQTWSGSSCQCTTGATCGSLCCGTNFICSSSGTCVPSCFVGETRIAMADGTSRPIADILAGDLVLGDNGAINRVTANDHLMLGSQPLYGFNGSAPFVTASHPFMTEDGWRAIDPASTYSDHHLPAVQRLEVGDRLVLLTGVSALVGAGRGMPTLDSRMDLRTAAFPLESTASIEAPPDTPIFNLRLDGNHTYFVNDLLVHNKV